MKIKTIYAHEIFDARGMPTVECCVVLENDAVYKASVSTGNFKSSFEAYELRDGGERLNGLGVHKAIAAINNEIGPLFVDQEPDGVHSADACRV